jgi:nucleotide-binding universal stress UspA family protein
MSELPPMSELQLVVGWTGAPRSVAALRFAADLAGRITARLHVAHVVEMADTPIDPDGQDWEIEFRTRLTELERRAEAVPALDRLTAGWTYHALRGEAPARLLFRLATEVDAYAIVLGSPHTGLAGLLDQLAGSRVTRGVLAHDHTIPVISVPARDHE